MTDIILRIAGKRLSLGITRMRILQQINGIPSAHLDVDIARNNHDSSDVEAQSAAGELVTGSTVEIGLNGTVMFSGHLTQKRLSLRGTQWSLQLEARHVLQNMVFLPRSRVFRQQSDVTVMNTLFKQAGVSMTRKGAVQQDVLHDQMVQFRVSDWQFILSRLFATNCWLLPDAASNNVTLAPLTVPAVAASHKLELQAEHNAYTLYEIDLNFDNRFTSSALSLQGWDIAEQKLGTAQKNNGDSFVPWKATGGLVTSPKRKQEYQLAFSHMPETAPATLSRSWINHQQLTGVQGRIVLGGTHDFRAGESVELKKLGAGLNGTAVLTGVNQLFNKAEGWRTELLVGLPPRFPEPVPTVQSLHIGTVADFIADPQGLDRIPVSLPALNLPGEFIFARLGKPWASKASGFCFYPEPGDEVVLGFIESDPRYPVILDSLHNPKNSAPFSPDKKNNLKGLVVNKNKSMQQLMMNTEEKNVTLSVDDVAFRLNTEEGILLDTTEELIFSAKNIKGEASDELSLSGNKKVKIISPSINLKKS